MRRFHLHLDKDEDDPSAGIVAEGVAFTSGKCVIQWLKEYPSTSQFDTIEDLLHNHGHSASIRIVWKDSNDSQVGI